ncbi:MAG: VOC family protein [Candidatus Dormibacteria bacterium]
MSTTISPYLLYRDAEAALGWLAAAFGFQETMRLADEAGRVHHAEMEFDGGVIMLGSPAGDFRTPQEVGSSTHLTHVYVADVDTHHARARDAGAGIPREPANQSYGERTYEAVDPEGHRWYFAQRLG